MPRPGWTSVSLPDDFLEEVRAWLVPVAKHEDRRQDGSLATKIVELARLGMKAHRARTVPMEAWG